MRNKRKPATSGIPFLLPVCHEVNSLPSLCSYCNEVLLHSRSRSNRDKDHGPKSLRHRAKISPSFFFFFFKKKYFMIWGILKISRNSDFITGILINSCQGIWKYYLV
jgi:hypothetical protein